MAGSLIGTAMLLVAPAPTGGHVGVILNRPTRRTLSSLFPEHEPSKKVVDPVYYGGPFSRGALVAILGAGAYADAMWSPYNGRPRPARLSVARDGSISVDREREPA